MSEIPEVIRDGWRIRWAPGIIGIAVPEGEEFPEDGKLENTALAFVGAVFIVNGMPQFSLTVADYCILQRTRGDLTTYSAVCRPIEDRDKYPNWPMPEPAEEKVP